MQQQDYASQMQVRKSKNGLKSTEISRFLFAHNPEAVGSNPTSATKDKTLIFVEISTKIGVSFFLSIELKSPKIVTNHHN